MEYNLTAFVEAFREQANAEIDNLKLELANKNNLLVQIKLEHKRKLEQEQQKAADHLADRINTLQTKAKQEVQALLSELREAEKKLVK